MTEEEKVYEIFGWPFISIRKLCSDVNIPYSSVYKGYIGTRKSNPDYIKILYTYLDKYGLVR